MRPDRIDYGNYLAASQSKEVQGQTCGRYDGRLAYAPGKCYTGLGGFSAGFLG